MALNVTDLSSRFPRSFLFGVATAAFQVEGAAGADGRGPSIWDAFAKMPGRTHGRHDGDVACDHYNRLESDLDLIRDLGVDAYRFSIAWPRILPVGRGPVNEKGLAFYERLVDGLKARGIKAYATLYHWDLPLMLAGDGGWTSRATAEAFASYADIIARRLGDRLDSLATFNEPWCSVWNSHLYGNHAPGERSMDAALHALHYTNLAHGLGVAAIRAARADLPVGIVLNAHATLPLTGSEIDEKAAERAFSFHNGVFFDPIFKGSYPEDFMGALGERMPAIEAGDLESIAAPLDFWGLNYYTPMRVQHDASSGAQFPNARPVVPDGVARTDIGWEIEPAGLAHLIRDLNRRYRLPSCVITENGACYNTEPADGVVDDRQRVDYLALHIATVAQMIEEGYDIRGYFAWSLMDNFEWAEGYSMRFGIVHVDYETQVRTVKRSGEWYRDLAIAHRADAKAGGQ